MDAFYKYLTEHETELEEYSPWYPGLKPKFPSLLTRSVHIRLLDCISREWYMVGVGGDLSPTWIPYGVTWTSRNNVKSLFPA